MAGLLRREPVGLATVALAHDEVRAGPHSEGPVPRRDIIEVGGSVQLLADPIRVWAEGLRLRRRWKNAVDPTDPRAGAQLRTEELFRNASHAWIVGQQV